MLACSAGLPNLGPFELIGFLLIAGLPLFVVGFVFIASIVTFAPRRTKNKNGIK
jgi:hypothetical protein